MPSVYPLTRMIESETITRYNASRGPHTDTSVLCHAPFVSLNFDCIGRVTACCYNRRKVLGVYPDRSLREIWTGAEARAMRESFRHNRETAGCNLCFHQLHAGSFDGALMRSFDKFSSDEGYSPTPEPRTPRVLEFEISNLCNLECVMCDGRWSSSIRAHREKLPALQSPYDNAFVEQLEEYLPSIAAAKFLGGEPFLIKLHYEIWERLRRVNPEAELSITTNATIVPDRAWRLLEGLRAHIAVSLDAVDPVTFETIRKKARFDQVMANVESLLAYTRRRGTSLSLAVCPMTHNWRRLPEVLAFCTERQISLHFNTVLRPPGASLASLADDELAEVIEHLERFRPAADSAWGRSNREAWDGLVRQLQHWRELHVAHRSAELDAQLRAFAKRHPGVTSGWTTAHSFERLVSPLVRSFSTGRERRKKSLVQWELRHRLPQVIEIDEGDDGPQAIDVVLGAHLLCRLLDEIERGDRAKTEALLEEQRLLCAHLETEATASLEPLAGWLSERLRSGRGDTLIPWVRVLLDILERPASWRGALAQGLSELESLGRDRTECRQALKLFEAMVVPFVPLPRAACIAETAASPARDAPTRLPAIRDLHDLRRLGDAVYLFHRCHEPDGDHSALRRHLDDTLSLVSEPGEAHLAYRSLAGGERTLFELLAAARGE